MPQSLWKNAASGNHSQARRFHADGYQQMVALVPSLWITGQGADDSASSLAKARVKLLAKWGRRASCPLITRPTNHNKDL
jgi:hypothetical protein